MNEKTLDAFEKVIDTLRLQADALEKMSGVLEDIADDLNTLVEEVEGVDEYGLTPDDYPRLDVSFNEDRTKLWLTPTKALTKELVECREEDDQNWFASAAHEDHLLQMYVYKGGENQHKLGPVFAEETGDLTDAPLIGIRSRNGKVVERWGYMDYQVRSFIESLVEGRPALFVGGRLNPKRERKKQ